MAVYETIGITIWMGERAATDLTAVAPLFTMAMTVLVLPIIFAALNYRFITKGNYRAWLIFPILATMEALTVGLGYLNWGITSNTFSSGKDYLLNPDGETIMIVNLEFISGLAICLIGSIIVYFLLRKHNTKIK